MHKQHKTNQSSQSNQHKSTLSSSYLLIGAPLFATILSASILSLPLTHAEGSTGSNGTGSTSNTNVVDEINITVPVSCTISGTGTDSHHAEIQNGIYTPNIGTTTIHAFCNDNNGFSIYAAGYTGDEVGGENSNKLVGTALTSNATIVSGISTSTTTPDISNWAMKLAISQDSGDTTSTNAFTIDSAPNIDLPSTAESTDTPASFSQYHVVPNEYTKVAHKNTATNMTDTTGGVKLTTTYAAYISNTQPADTYTGQVIYTLVHPSTAPAPGSILAMQDIANWRDTIAEGQEVEAVDTRDNKVYTVAKLADGNIWMTQNLDHDIKTDGTVVYNSTTTDLPENTTWTPNSATLTASNASSWTGSYTAPQSYDPGELYWNGTLSDYSDWGAYWGSCTWNDTTMKYENCNESLNPLSAYISSTGDSHYHLGNCYNFTAAVAMNDSSAYTTDGQQINQSICPAGWTLPYVNWNNTTYEPEGDFYDLWNAYGLAYTSFIDNNNNYTYDTGEQALWTSPLYFAPSGSFSGSVGDVGFGGYFWSPVVGNERNARYARFFVDGDADPSNVVGRYYGISVRCLARPAF